jgi:hypothetical protein
MRICEILATQAPSFWIVKEGQRDLDFDAPVRHWNEQALAYSGSTSLQQCKGDGPAYGLAVIRRSDVTFRMCSGTRLCDACMLRALFEQGSLIATQ